MDEEYVEVSEGRAEREVDELREKIEDPSPQVGIIKDQDEVKNHLLDGRTDDFNIDAIYWDGKGMEPEEVGYVKEIDPTQYTSHEGVKEGFMISAMAIDDALRRIAHIMKDKKDGLIYFHVVTPDQEKPTVTFKDIEINGYWRLLAAWEEARRTGKLRRKYYDV